MNADTAFAPFLVRAHLSTGLAHASPWGIALDGILAAELWADHKASALDRGEYVPALSPQATPPDLELPLAHCTLAGADWHWCATCSFPEDPAGDPVVRHWASRTDHRGLEELASSVPAVISDRQGRYRARYMPLMITNSRTVTWRGVGDLTAVAAIVSGLDVIGKKRAHGEGRVCGGSSRTVQVRICGSSRTSTLTGRWDARHRHHVWPREMRRSPRGSGWLVFVRRTCTRRECANFTCRGSGIGRGTGGLLLETGNRSYSSNFAAHRGARPAGPWVVR